MDWDPILFHDVLKTKTFDLNTLKEPMDYNYLKFNKPPLREI
jgi:hypothetical protein